MVTDGPTTLLQNTLTLIGSAVVLLVAGLAARARDPDRVPGDGHRHGDLPPLLGPRLPAHPRAHGRGDREPAGGHLRRARRAGVPARGRELPALPRGQRRLPRPRTCRRSTPPRSTSRSSSLLSATATAVVLGYGGVLVFEASSRPAPVRVHRASVELLRPGAAAVAVLPDPAGGNARRSTRWSRCWAPSPPCPTRRRRAAAARSSAGSSSTTSGSPTPPGAAEVLHGVSFDGRARPDGRTRRPHRRRQVDHREAARPVLRPDRPAGC